MVNGMKRNGMLIIYEYICTHIYVEYLSDIKVKLIK